MDVWLPPSGEQADSGPLALPPECTGAVLVITAGQYSSICIDGTQDGGKSWKRLASRATMAGCLVATYSHQGAYGTTKGVRMTHLRVKATRAGKGAVKAGLEILFL